MPNDDQMNYPGEEHHYDQNPAIPKDQPPSILGSYTSPIANYPDMPPPTYPQPPERRKRPNALLILSVVIAVLVVAVGGLAYALLSKSGTATIPTTTQGTQQTTPGQENGTPTAIANNVATTPQTQALVASGTVTENLQLTCGANCNDPIHVTITTIQVDDGNGNMIWNISLKNVSGISMGYGINKFELLPSGSQTQIHATFPQSQSMNTLPNSDPMSIQGTFAFVPVQNTTYTLTVVVDENPFGGPQITFDPAQITNL